MGMFIFGFSLVFIIHAFIVIFIWSVCKVYERIGLIIWAIFLSVLFGCMSWVIGHYITIRNGTEYDIGEVSEVIKVDNVYIGDLKIVVQGSDHCLNEYHYLDNRCRIESSEKEYSYIEIYDNCKWVSDTNQFLYGDAPTYYIIYLKDD